MRIRLINGAVVTVQGFVYPEHLLILAQLREISGLRLLATKDGKAVSFLASCMVLDSRLLRILNDGKRGNTIIS